MENKAERILLKIAVFAAECAFGVLLLIKPPGTARTIIILFGMLNLVYAVINVVYYFKLEPFTAVLRQCLSKGLLAFVLGGFCVCCSKWIIANISFFTIIYGTGILISGLFKLQTAANLRRMNYKRWSVDFSALISIIFSVIIIGNSFTSTAFLWQFVGISFLLVSVWHLVFT